MNITDILEQKWVLPAAAGIAGVIVGAGGGYILGKRNGFSEGMDRTTNNINYYGDSSDLDENVMVRLRKEIEEIEDGNLPSLLDAPVEDVIIVNDEPHIQYDSVVEAMLSEDDSEDGELVQAVIDAGGELNVMTGPPDVPVTVQRAKVFDTPDDEWDEEAEVASRVEGQPYVITKDQFFNGETGYNQNTLTYYQGDDILTNELESPIYNPQDIVGPYKFGHGSGAATVFYVRNDTLEREFEVVCEPGKYEVEVLGHTIEQEYEDSDNKSSASPAKFRGD